MTDKDFQIQTYMTTIAMIDYLKASNRRVDAFLKFHDNDTNKELRKLFKNDLGTIRAYYEHCLGFVGKLSDEGDDDVK